MKWIKTKDETPPELEDKLNIESNRMCPESHKNKLWVATENYGEMPAFYHKGKFMSNYACEINDPVIAWLHLPRYYKDL